MNAEKTTSERMPDSTDSNYLTSEVSKRNDVMSTNVAHAKAQTAEKTSVNDLEAGANIDRGKSTRDMFHTKPNRKHA
jgi:hypothetical protein